MTFEMSANQTALYPDDDADWWLLDITSPLPWETSDNVTSLPDGGGASCYRTMGFVIYTLVAGILCVLGLAGNTVAYLVLGGDGDMLPVAKFLVRSLAIADNFFLLVFFLNFSVAQLFSFTGVDRAHFNQTAWMTSRLVIYPLSFVAQTAAIWLNVLIAASRCLAVCWPQKSSVYCSLQATQIGVAGVGVFSAAFNIPRWMESKLVRVAVDNGTRTVNDLQRTDLGKSYAYQLVYFDTLYYIFMFILPLVLLTVFNSRLIIVYRRFRQKRAALRGYSGSSAGSRRRQQESSEQNVTLIMIVVILIFMLCNVPAKVVQAVWRYELQPCMSASFFLSELSSVLEVFSSAVNFVVYCAFLRRFRHRLLAALCCRGGVASGSRDDRLRTVAGSTLQPLASTTGGGIVRDGARTEEIVDETSVQL